MRGETGSDALDRAGLAGRARRAATTWPGAQAALQALAALPKPRPLKPPSRPPVYPRLLVRERVRDALGTMHRWSICNRCLAIQLALPVAVVARQTHWLGENDEYTRELWECDFCDQHRFVIQVDPW